MFLPAEESNLTHHTHIGIWLSTVTTYHCTILQLVVQGLRFVRLPFNSKFISKRPKVLLKGHFIKLSKKHILFWRTRFTYIDDVKSHVGLQLRLSYNLGPLMGLLTPLASLPVMRFELILVDFCT